MSKRETQPAAKRVAEIERLRGENCEMRQIIADTLWMAQRYAEGRNTYAPDMARRAIERAQRLGIVDTDLKAKRVTP